MKVQKVHYQVIFLIIVFCFIASLSLYLYRARRTEITSSKNKRKETNWKLPYYKSETKLFYRCIEPKTVALTFDDSPSDFIPLALKTLNKYKVPATFYIVGKTARIHPQFVKLLDEDPLAMIGSHTYDHDPSLLFVESERKVREQVEGGIEILYNITGKRFRHFRPPHFNFDKFGYLEKRSGLAISLSSIDAEDWELHWKAEESYANENASDIHSAKVLTEETLERIEEQLDEDEGDEEGHIYLGHDRQFVFMGLHRIIRFLTKRGYTLIRMDRCTGVPEIF